MPLYRKSTYSLQLYVCSGSSLLSHARRDQESIFTKDLTDRRRLFLSIRNKNSSSRPAIFKTFSSHELNPSLVHFGNSVVRLCNQGLSSGGWISSSSYWRIHTDRDRHRKMVSVDYEHFIASIKICVKSRNGCQSVCTYQYGHKAFKLCKKVYRWLAQMYFSNLKSND